MYWNTWGVACEKLLVRYFGVCNHFFFSSKNKSMKTVPSLRNVCSTLCLLALLFLNKCPQIKEIHPPLWIFKYTCLYIYIRCRTLDPMYCQNSYLQRSLSSYAEVGTKSVWFLLLAFGETKGKWNKQMS